MNIELIPTLIDQFRETFEGETEPGVCWITSGPRASAIFGTIEQLTHEQAFAPPPGRAPGGKSVAPHVAHVSFALELTLRRMMGENPPADWPGSFVLPGTTPQVWETIKAELRDAYEGLRDFLQERRGTPIEQWQSIQLAGLSATTAHNAYHLGAIRQIARAIKGELNG